MQKKPKKPGLESNSGEFYDWNAAATPLPVCENLFGNVSQCSLAPALSRGPYYWLRESESVPPAERRQHNHGSIFGTHYAETTRTS
jgi:hypothetical protein